MIAARFAICVALAIAGAVALKGNNVSPAASHHLPTNPQEQYLARSGSANFACRVNEIRVTTDSPGEGDAASLVTPDAIRDSFASLATLEWAHIAQTSFSSVDGRNDEKVLATPGGDMGEFIHAIAAFEKVSGTKLSEDEVQESLEKYLKIMSRPKFFYETDEKAYMRLAVATGCRNLRVNEMGGMRRKQKDYLAHISNPDHIGDPYLSYLAANSDSMLLSSDLVGRALSAFHKVLWTSPSLLASKLCYLEVKGSSHSEKALVTVKPPPYCIDQGLAPMVSPQLACPAPVMLVHPDAVRVLRRELVAVLSEGENGVDAVKMMGEMNQMAESNFAKFWGDYGAGLPQYTVEFSNSSPLLTSERTFKP